MANNSKLSNEMKEALDNNGYQKSGKYYQKQRNALKLFIKKNAYKHSYDDAGSKL